MSDKLFEPVELGAIHLKNRVVMAPLTRSRAGDGDVTHDLHVEYYAQRAGAGLIIAEATQISPEGKGYIATPGIYSPAQIAGWKKVTEAVHSKGGKIVLQIWHVGRISHVNLQPNGQAPVSASAIRAEAMSHDGTDYVPASTPRALETSEMPRLVEEYRQAAVNAKEAGFDGIEIHAANGYLIEQFLRSGTNKRDDAYGGPVDNRLRLLREVMDAVLTVWDANRVGVRISPFSPGNGIGPDAESVELYEQVIDALEPLGLAYLHAIEGATGGGRDWPEGAMQALRKRFSGPYIANNGYDRDLAIRAVDSGEADAVAFGRPYISNPDLAERLAKNAPLNPPATENVYGGGAKGYTDYPKLAG
ncbi:alkene reductase [Falsirhodobacter xinxiangensis]|uniref:alkene reductase n=1 Tax=Falsirhodobacter xinxiangensis TaxID=2530049 RepID=UPI0010AB4982|nr:alkene reductase [Rhodobacter xinxiangensis]